MDQHQKKMIAPIVVTVLVILYYLIYFFAMITVLPGIWKVLLGIIPIIFVAVMIYVCVQRINEIKGGEEDDLSKY